MGLVSGLMGLNSVSESYLLISYCSLFLQYSMYSSLHSQGALEVSGTDFIIFRFFYISIKLIYHWFSFRSVYSNILSTYS